MRCTHCGTYFCWLCLSQQPCSSSTHSHVRRCVENPRQGQLFLLRKETDSAHRVLRMVALRRALGTSFGPKWHKDSRLRRLVREDVKIKACLADCRITVLDLFDSQILTQQQQRARNLNGGRFFALFRPHDDMAGPVGGAQGNRTWIWVVLVACLLQYTGFDVCGVLGKIVVACMSVTLFWLRNMLGHFCQLLWAVLEWGTVRFVVVGKWVDAWLMLYGPGVVRVMAQLVLSSVGCVLLATWWALAGLVKALGLLGVLLMRVR